MKNNYTLTIDQYFSLIQQKIKDKDFKIQKITSEPASTISIYLEAVNYMMYEFSQDHEDKRQLFPYIIVPNNTDWDFTKISLKDFIKFLAENKSKEIETIDTKDIDIIEECQSIEHVYTIKIDKYIMNLIKDKKDVSKYITGLIFNDTIFKE